MAWFNFLNFFKTEKKVEPVKHQHIYAYDFDGVVSIGVTPRHENDVIITGRCEEEAEYVYSVLEERGITNKVYFNPMTLEDRGNHTLKSRRFSGKHKAKTIQRLAAKAIHVDRFFEDDRVQAKIVSEKWPKIQMVIVDSNLVEK